MIRGIPIIEDFRTLDPASPIETDLCIVGSGFAGWTIADQLRDSALRVLIVESGGTEFEDGVEHPLDEFESVGVSRWNGRCRVLGGTSERWTGRCIPLDDIDYEPRSWMPLSGWPFRSDTIAPYLDRASELLGAGPYLQDGTRPAPHGVQRVGVDPKLLRNVSWQHSRGTTKREPVRLRQALTARPCRNLRILVHATVTHLNTNASGGTIESVEISDLNGKRATVRSRAVVLCAGGVENARIMLYSNRVMPKGLGNSHDVVGRFLIDHPHTADFLVRFNIRDIARVRALFGPYKASGGRGRHVFVDGLALSPELQRRNGLLNCVAFPDEHISVDDPLDATKRLISGPRDGAGRDLKLVLSQPGFMLHALVARMRDQLAARKVDIIGLVARSEQRPDRDSRIRLSTRSDRLGLPIPEIDWRIHAEERSSLAVLARTIASEFRRLRLPSVDLADWVRERRYEDAVFQDSCHPSGTTRMASDPRHGVVDSQCQVHGVAGLYVAGSSVFPTVGHANPTLMIVALAIRLAHHLREHLLVNASARAASRSTSWLAKMHS